MGILLLMAIVCAVLGFAIGNPKGHGGLGAVLGGLLGIIGLIIVVVMQPASATTDAPR